MKKYLSVNCLCTKRNGRTNLVTAAQKGAARAGVPTELVQIADHVVVVCKDCLPRFARPTRIDPTKIMGSNPLARRS